MLADFDPAVVGIAAQPMQLTAPDGPRLRRHVPDLLLVGRHGEVTVVDVKAPHKRDDGATQAVMAWTRQVVGLRGWEFEDWYEAPRLVLANVTFLAGTGAPSWSTPGWSTRSATRSELVRPLWTSSGRCRVGTSGWCGRSCCTCSGAVIWSPI
jgi:hypothetical protein